jgi:hypothetical protein
MDKKDDPAYMDWPTLNASFNARFEDDEIQDDDLFATRSETAAILSWVRHFERKSLPRSEEEQKTYDLIKRAADLLKTKTGWLPMDTAPTSGNFLVYNQAIGVCEAVIHQDGSIGIAAMNGAILKGILLGWQPMPAPPKE